MLLALTGCQREQTVSDDSQSNGITVPATLFIPTKDNPAPSTKVTLNDETLQFTWNSGDAIAIMATGVGNYINFFSTDAEGTAYGQFTGTVTVNPETTPTLWVGVNPYSAASSFTSANGNTVIGISASQSGALADVGDNYVSIAQNGNQIKDSGDYNFYMDDPLTPFCSIVRFNVPAVLNVTRILVSGSKDSAPHGIAGSETIKLNVGNVCKNTPSASESEIEISRSGSVISGDVYVCLLPDTMGDDPKVYHNSADAVKIRLEKATGQYWEKTISINSEHPLTAGKLMNFGSVPTTISFSELVIAKPTLTYTTDKKLVASCTTPGVTFYYTSDPLCEPEDPTTSDTVLPAAGVELTSTQFIKVIAAIDDVTSEIAEANLRYWDRSEESTSVTATIPASGQYNINSWFYLTTVDGTAHNNVSVSSSGIAPNSKTPYVRFNVASLTDGTGMFFIQCHYASNRYVPAFIGDTQIASSGNKPAIDSFVKLGEETINVGTISYCYFSNASDSGTKLVTFAFFETGDVDFPTPTCQTPVFTYEEGKVVATSTSGATIYYTIGDALPANPTASSEVFPAEGLTIASGKYFKAIAIKDGYNNSAVASGAFRKWNYSALNSYFEEDITEETNADVTSSYLLYNNPLVSDWLTLSTTSDTYYLKARCGKGYSVSGSTETFSCTNLLNGNVKLYLRGYKSSDKVVLVYKPSSSAATQSCEQGVLVNGQYSLGATSAIESGETSQFWVNKGHRISDIVFLESGVTTGLSLMNQPFD